MKKKLIFLFLLSSVTCFSQSNWKKFKKLSAPKKWWVITHPFKAKCALKISEEARQLADSIQKTNVLDKDPAGGQVDAFRHAYWMARLQEKIGKKAARRLGKAHEKENYLTYKKQKLEEGIVPDNPSRLMDLYNNEAGLKLTVKGGKTPKKGLIYRVINAIYAGKMKVLKKDKKGQFLTCENQIIKPIFLKGKWENNKCLVRSNYKNSN